MGTILESVTLGDREFLTALRDHLALTLDGSPPPHTIAGLTKQLMDVRQALKALESADGEDDIGEAINVPDAKFTADSL